MIRSNDSSNITVTLEMSTMQWANLDRSEKVEPINESDYQCLAEIRDTLNKHGKCDRFGVALLHKHFELADDELLMEYINKQDRVLTTKPIKISAAGEAVETIWMLRDGDRDRMLDCQQYCFNDPNPDHPHKCKE